MLGHCLENAVLTLACTFPGIQDIFWCEPKPAQALVQPHLMFSYNQEEQNHLCSVTPNKFTWENTVFESPDGDTPTQNVQACAWGRNFITSFSSPQEPRLVPRALGCLFSRTWHMRLWR